MTVTIDWCQIKGFASIYTSVAPCISMHGGSGTECKGTQQCSAEHCSFECFFERLSVSRGSAAWIFVFHRDYGVRRGSAAWICVFYLYIKCSRKSCGLHIRVLSVHTVFSEGLRPGYTCFIYIYGVFAQSSSRTPRHPKTRTDS